MKRIIAFVIACLAIASSADAQFFKRKINQYKDGLRDGKWITYFDSLNTKIESKGKFKKGREKGKWKYYSEDGLLRRKEVIKNDKLFITYYYDNGKKENCGMAYLVADENFLHFYWTGEWKYYERNGKLKKISTFEKGEAISERIIEN